VAPSRGGIAKMPILNLSTDLEGLPSLTGVTPVSFLRPRSRRYFFFPGRRSGYLAYTARLIPAGRGALCANFNALFARALVLIG